LRLLRCLSSEGATVKPLTVIDVAHTTEAVRDVFDGYVVRSNDYEVVRMYARLSAQRLSDTVAAKSKEVR
jgi:hypothetical protein